MTQDVYAYWRAACDGKRDDTLALPTIGAHGIPSENPQCGLWKVRPRKGEHHVLMHIWLVDDAEEPQTEWREGLRVRAIAGYDHLAEDALATRWLYAQPVTNEEAAYYHEHERWPSDPPPLGHNRPSDPHEAIVAEAEERIEQAKARIADISDQTACDMARNLHAELTALIRRGDEMHEAEKRPHLEAGRAVDRRYEWRKTVTDWAGRLRRAFGDWMAQEEARRRAEAEERHCAEVAKAEAERARILAEREKLMDDDPIQALTSQAPELPPLPAAPEVQRVQAGGGVGRRAGLKTTWDVEVTDIAAAAAHLSSQPDVAIAVGKAAMRLVKAAKGKVEIPGVKVIERRVAA